MQVSGIVSKRVFNESTVYYSLRLSCNTEHITRAYGQWSAFDHNGDKQSVVLWTRYATSWPWNGQIEVGWLQAFPLWLSTWISSMAPVLVSRDIDLCRVQLHPTWLNQLLDIWVDQWLQICIVDTCQWVYSGFITWSSFPFASWFILWFPSVPPWLGIQQK